MKKIRVSQATAILLAIVMLIAALSGCAEVNDPEFVTTEDVFAPAETEPSAPTEPAPTETVTEAALTDETDNETEEPTEALLATEPNVTDEDTQQFSQKQRIAINMLNYLTVMTQQINMSKDSRLFLEETYDALVNFIYPNAVDDITGNFLSLLLETIAKYRMIDEKRERLEYLYEQNRAQRIREAIPNPLSLLSAVESKSLLEAAASVVFIAVDSVTSYEAYKEQNDLQYLKDGWELDDEEAEVIHQSRSEAFQFMIDITNEYDIPGEYALNENAVKEFVKWENETNVESRIEFFKSNEQDYKEYGGYWLALAESYYENEDYADCLNAIDRYEAVATRIFRKDYSFAKVLPLAIVAAKEVQPENKYVKTADRFCTLILENSDASDFTIRYYVAQVLIDLNAITGEQTYLERAYQIALDNVNGSIRDQRDKNAEYLADVVEIAAPDGATKREKQEVKDYNKMLKETRKTALPPVNETLRLNCELLFGLGEELNKSDEEWKRIDRILHENGENLFLNKMLDDQFRRNTEPVDENSISISFDGNQISVPAVFLTDSAAISVSVQSSSGNAVLDDWTIEKVERLKNAEPEGFSAIYTSQKAKEHKYAAGDTVTIRITPFTQSGDGADNTLTFKYQVVGKKVLLVFNGIAFERILK